MKNNLEGISFDEVFDENGVKYSVFRTSLQPHYSKVMVDILKGYLFILLLSILIILSEYYFNLPWWLIIPAGSLFIGYIAAYLALFIHEAGHYNIHPDKRRNDRLAILFLCIPFGLSITAYRKIHWQHHIHLGTPSDTENSYFNGFTKLFLLESLTGIHLLRTMKRKEGNKLLTSEQRKNSKAMLLAGILFHLIILVISLLFGFWKFAITWFLGFLIFFPFFATIRQILEHRDELARHTTDFFKQPHGKTSRLFIHTLLSSSFGSAGFTRHMIHHWDPHISYTRLKDIEDFLLRCRQTSLYIKEAKTRYRTVLKKLLLAN
jgi:fatty acid desaturase